MRSLVRALPRAATDVLFAQNGDDLDRAARAATSTAGTARTSRRRTTSTGAATSGCRRRTRRASAGRRCAGSRRRGLLVTSADYVARGRRRRRDERRRERVRGRCAAVRGRHRARPAYPPGPSPARRLRLPLNRGRERVAARPPPRRDRRVARRHPLGRRDLGRRVAPRLGVRGDQGDPRRRRRTRTSGSGKHILEARYSEPWRSTRRRRHRARSWSRRSCPTSPTTRPAGRRRGRADLPEGRRASEPPKFDVAVEPPPMWTGTIELTPRGTCRRSTRAGSRTGCIPSEGEFLGTVYVYGSMLPARLVALVTRGNEAMFERMAALVEPGRRQRPCCSPTCRRRARCRAGCRAPPTSSSSAR